MRFLKWAWNGFLRLWHRCLSPPAIAPTEPEPEPLPSFGDSGATAPRGTPEFRLQEMMHKAMKSGPDVVILCAPMVSSAYAIAEATERQKDPSDPRYYYTRRPTHKDNVRAMELLCGRDRDPDRVSPDGSVKAERILTVEQDMRDHLEKIEAV